MGRNKLERFEDNRKSIYVVEDGKPFFGECGGKWKSDFFKNDNDLIVELGCGRGEYTIGLGTKFLNKNFVGVDIKGSRIWVGSRKAKDLEMKNVAFLRTQIELIERHFGVGEIDELWITFPDPRPKDRDEKRRLTAPNFLRMYRSLIRDDGWVKFKTDNTDLFNYTLEVLQTEIKIKNLEYTFDLYDSELILEHHDVKTKYETLFFEKGESIKYMKFQFYLSGADH